MDNADALRVDVVTPFDNRRADNWRVMLAIADLAGEEWGAMARAAAVKLEAASDTTSPAVQCVIHIKKIFDEDGCEAILSLTLVTRLKEDVEAPWLEWNRGKGLSQKGLADLLGGRRRGQGNRGGFGIFSVDVHLPGGIHGKGYHRSQFEQVWLRYGPDEPGSGGE